VSEINASLDVKRTKVSLASSSVAMAAASLILLYVLFVPRWETNDDVAMSMVAHGYGIAAYGSPNIIFSNVLWGYLVRLIPTIHGVLGYSIASIGVLFAAWTATLYFLRRLDIGLIVSFFVVALVFIRPTLFPQFTLNSGLLTTTAIFGLLDYFRTKEIMSLVVGCIFAFLGYLVRSQEFVLVVAISLPFFARREILVDKKGIVAVAALFALIVIAWAFDSHCYASPAWDTFKMLNLTRAPFTDFGAADEILKHPDILAHHGYSDNDIRLIENFFFVDPHTSNPRVLGAMLEELGPHRFFAGTFSSGVDSIGTLLAPVMFPIVILAALLFALRPTYRMGISWAIMVGAFFTLGVLGRGGIARVEIPGVTLLCFLGLLQTNESDGHTARHSILPVYIPRSVIACALAICVAINCWIVFADASVSAGDIKAQQEGVAEFPREPVVVWGAALSFESIFPLLEHDDNARQMRLFPFGVFTQAPFSVAASEESNGHGFIDRIRSSAGVLMIADPANLEKLRVWCGERFSGELEKSALQSAPRVRIDRVWCRR
jgi:hypothetical protein